YGWEHEYLYFVQMANYLGIKGVTDRPKKNDATGQYAAYMNLIPNNGPVRRSVFFCPSSTWQTSQDYATAVTGAGGVMPWWEYTSYAIFTTGWTQQSVDWWSAGGTSVFDANGNVANQTAAEFLLGRRMASSANPAAAGVFAHYVRQYGITVWWQMESAYGWESPYYDYGGPDCTPHSFAVPHAFL